jgi:biopolymer transport protein ExbB
MLGNTKSRTPGWKARAHWRRALTGAVTAVAIFFAGPVALCAQEILDPAPRPAPAAEAAGPDDAAAPATQGAPLIETLPVSEVMQPDPSAPGAPAVDVPAVAASAPGDVEAEKLPRDLSPWNMFMSADIVVKAVMIGLIFASFVTWTVWFAKSLELAAAKHRLARALREIDESRSLGDAAGLVQQRRGVGPALVNAAALELRQSWSGAGAQGIKDRIASRLERLELAAARDINKGTGVLATIGSTAPFVGLFGTVWGIMNSFIGISEAQTTNLAIVAPGIAEALLATAFGLVAAIPAVIFYNQLARAIGGYKALVGDTGAAVMRLASRDFERGASVGLRAAE